MILSMLKLFFQSNFFPSNCPNFLTAFIILQENWMNLPWRKYYQAVRRYFILKSKPYWGAHSNFGGCSGYLLHQGFFFSHFKPFIVTHAAGQGSYILFLHKKKNSLTYLWLGFAYVCVTTLFWIINFSSEHFKDTKGIAPVSTLRSVEVSS